ncbi:LD-carboxypeptidase [Streptomyces noursei]|uniref:LD-carboxypeptidase n=1 Tax=Streptomyces noursei TaxID=1971 RepID=UPI003BF5155A
MSDEWPCHSHADCYSRCGVCAGQRREARRGASSGRPRRCCVTLSSVHARATPRTAVDVNGQWWEGHRVDTSHSFQSVCSPRLRPGDRVRIVSPASPPNRAGVTRGIELLSSWGLRVELGEHVFDHWGYMAGQDEDRAFDVNWAFRDPGVRAVIVTRGGKWHDGRHCLHGHCGLRLASSRGCLGPATKRGWKSLTGLLRHRVLLPCLGLWKEIKPARGWVPPGRGRLRRCRGGCPWSGVATWSRTAGS